MFIRIYWSRIRPGAWPALEEKYRELAAINVPGRLARWVTQDANDPESLLTVTLWEDQSSVFAWEGSDAYRHAVDAVQPYQVGSQTVSLCEVKLENADALARRLAGPAQAQ